MRLCHHAKSPLRCGLFYGQETAGHKMSQNKKATAITVAFGFLSQEFGGATRDRTADLLHAMQALSQLSYNPKFCTQQMVLAAICRK